jgi:membrane-associated phospholipid phosphatase
MDVRKLARIVSIVGHPFVLVPLAIVLATRDAARTRVPVLGAVLATMLILAIYVVRKWRRGELTDVDVSSREQRPRVFLVGIVASGAACLAMIATGQNMPVIRGTAIACITLVVMAIVNRLLLKASLHSAFAAIAAGIVWRASLGIAMGFAVVALVVGWSRVRYGRHTASEVAAGLAIGAIAALGYAREW